MALTSHGGLAFTERRVVSVAARRSTAPRLTRAFYPVEIERDAWIARQRAVPVAALPGEGWAANVTKLTFVGRILESDRPSQDGGACGRRRGQRMRRRKAARCGLGAGGDSQSADQRSSRRPPPARQRVVGDDLVEIPRRGRRKGRSHLAELGGIDQQNFLHAARHRGLLDRGLVKLHSTPRCTSTPAADINALLMPSRSSCARTHRR